MESDMRTLVLAGKLGPAFTTKPNTSGTVTVEVIDGDTVSMAYFLPEHRNAALSFVMVKVTESVEDCHIPCNACAICLD